MNMNIFLIDVFLMLLTRMMLRFVADVVVIVLETIIDICCWKLLMFSVDAVFTVVVALREYIVIISYAAVSCWCW